MGVQFIILSHKYLYFTMPILDSTHLTYREVVGVELGVGRSLSFEPGGWGGGKLSKLWGGTNLVTILLLSGATPEDGVVPEMWVLFPHLSAESKFRYQAEGINSCYAYVDRSSFIVVSIIHLLPCKTHITFPFQGQLLILFRETIAVYCEED